MVSEAESTTPVMSSACVDFSQHAWKKDLCVNCQQPRNKHAVDSDATETSDTGQKTGLSAEIGSDSPKPAKRNSIMAKSWTGTLAGENEDDKWNSMCLPDPVQPNKRFSDVDQRLVKPFKDKNEKGQISEHSYEEIHDNKSNEKANSTASANVSSRNNATVAIDAQKTGIAMNAEDRLAALVKDEVKLPSNKNLPSRSRSSSRENSPVPGIKPKISDKPFVGEKKTVGNSSKNESSMQNNENGSKKKVNKGRKSISFVSDDPAVIGEDGGLDNLYSDQEDNASESETNPKEKIEFSETEKEWALQSLKNTLWNSEHIKNEGKKKKHTQEFEDLKVESPKKPERSAKEGAGDSHQEGHNFGTFPLRTKSEKTVMDNMFSSNRLSTLSESSESVLTEEDKYDSVLRFLGADKLEKLDFNYSPRHKSAISGSEGADVYEASYDDPWCDKFGFGTDSEMNLLDEIKGEIDLDASGAGFALVEMLNDVLAKYGTGPGSETDSVKNFEGLDAEKSVQTTDKSAKRDGRELSADFEAKMVHLAANLRKHRATKGRAPRPPSQPPEPPSDGATKSPAKQAELRAAQSKEPTFKMVPLGKVIGTTPLEAQAKADLKSAHGAPRSELSSTSSSNSSDIVDVSKAKADKQGKKSGGIGGFFSRIFGKGKESDTDLTGSSDVLASNTWTMSDPYIENDGASNHSDTLENDVVPIKGGNQKERKMSNSSPQMKVKMAPIRPVSPKPMEMTSENSQKDDVSNPSQSQKVSDQSESNSSHNNTSEQILPNKNESKPKLEPVKQLSPTKDKETAKATSPKAKEAPPLPSNPPRDLSDHGMVPKPRTRPPPESVAPRSRPRTRELPEGRPRDTPNVPPPKPPVAVKPRPVSTAMKAPEKPERSNSSATGDSNVQPHSVMYSQSDAHSSENLANTEDSQKKADKNVDPKVLRKRAKSPKRIVAPIAPGRASMPNILSHSNTSLASTTSEVSIQSLPSGPGDNKHEGVKGLPFARELEQKLQKEMVAAETRKMSVPPPPPTVVKHPSLEKSKSLPADKQKTGMPDKSQSLPADRKQSVNENAVSSAVASKDVQHSKSSSKDDLKTNLPNAEDKSKILTSQVSASSSSSSSSTISPSSSSTTTAVSNTSAANTTKSAIADADQMTSATNVPPSTQPGEIIILPEKIELPRPVSNSRKSFLGKLNRNKNKPPAPPSVKRTKSITETSLLGDHHLKKIDLKDISGPVLITDMTSNKVVHRRNTISVGPDDNSFLSGGSTSSGSTSAGDNRDLSPHGSLENMYEFIKTEAPSPPVGDVKRNFYDPVVEGNAVIGLRPPSMTGSEGYLEPVRSHQLHQNSNNEQVNKMAESTISLGSMTTSFISTVTNMANKNRMNKSTNDVADDGESRNHVHDDLSPERRALLASQPIYEEITNGYGKLGSNNNDERDSKSDDQHSEFYGIGDVNQASSLKQKDSFSSDSELSSANSSLARPRPIPRRRPQQIGSGFEQYVAMNRPGVAVILNEDQLREMMSKLTSMNLNTIKDIYTQHEKCFTKENLNLGSVGPLKWHDFDIYGKPVHTSEKCVIYNAKLRNTLSPCQVMLLHSRPEITSANHPSLLKPTSIFTDSVPFSYLTDEFIKTSQILETCLNQTSANSAQCYIVVGLFDITESLAHHMSALETVCDNQKEFLAKVLFFVLQLLSAISHCLEQGHSLSEADFHDLYLISNPYCLGETVSFLPQVRASEDQQIDRVCLFLEQFLHDMCTKCDAAAVLDDSAIFIYTGIQKIMEMLESGVIECLPIVRSYTEYLLWGPGENESEFLDDRHSNLEPKLAMWLEKERAELIHDFARRIQHGARCNIRDFYKMKFLCKASSSSLAECIRCHAAAMETST